MTPRARRDAILLAALALSPVLAPVTAGAAPWTLAVTPGEADGASFPLLVEAGADAPTARVTLRLHVNHTGADGAGASWVEAHPRELAPGVRAEVRLNLSRGPGTYEADVRADGASAPATLVLEAPSAAPAEAALVVDVADAPTLLAFTSDSVNSAGKSKAPGDPLVTRVRVSDENGLDDVAYLEFAYARLDATGARVPVNATRLVALDGGNASLLSRVVEHRFADAPLPAGDYVESVTARPRSGEPVRVERAFRVTEARPALLHVTALAPAVASPGLDGNVTGEFLVGDRNFGTGPLDGASVAALGVLSARLYRGSTLVEAPGWTVDLGGSGGPALDLTGLGHREAWRYRVVDGHGALAVPVRVALPPGAAAGDYRVSLYHAADALATPAYLGQAPFVVADVPRVARLDLAPAVASPGARVVASFALDGPSADRVELTLLRLKRGEWTAVGEPRVVAPDAGPVTLEVPADLPPGEYAVEAAPAASAEAPAVPAAGRRASLTLHAGPPHLALRGPAGAARLTAGPLGSPVPLAVAARNFTLAEAALAWRLLDASGSEVDARVVPDAAGGFALDARHLPPGRYRLVASSASPEGAAESEVRVDVGAWIAVRAPATRAALSPAAGGLSGALPLASEGNAPVRRLLVVVGPFPGGAAATGEVRLVDASGAARATAALRDGQARLEGALLAPDEEVSVTVTLRRPPGLDAGRLEVPVRVHVLPGVA